MLRRYCFCCGAPLARETASPGELCQACRLGGPQVPPSRLRWEIQTRDGGTRGPLSRDALVDQLIRGAIQPEDRVTRGGRRWMPLVEHPDFAAYFLPGTPESERLVSTRTAATKERRSRDVRGVTKVAAAAVAMVGGLGLATIAIQNDLFVVPEEVVSSITSLAGDATDQVSDQIEQAVDQDAARRAVEAQRVLPGEALLVALGKTWPQPTGSPSLRLHRGRIGLWSGTEAGLLEAREHLEQAALLAPVDAEVWGSLAEVWARLSPREPALLEAMSVAADRAGALQPGSPAARRGAAAVARANGSRGRAADLLSECGAPSSLAGTRGSKVDLGCAVMLAELQQDEDALLTLDERLGGRLPIQIALARVHSGEGRHAEAMQLATRLTKANPAEPEPWRVLMASAVAVGDWGAARTAGQQVAKLAPWRLVERATLGAVELKVRGRPKAALDVLEGVISEEAFARHPDRLQVFADAAAAAIGSGRLKQAIALADRGLAEVRTHPAVGLQKARALHAQGLPAEAEKVLRSLEPGDLSGHQLARYHLGAARIYVDAGRERLAEAELTSAEESTTGWAMVTLEGARNRLLVGNRDGAVDMFESLAYMDLTRDHTDSPLHSIWFPAPDWSGLRKLIDQNLVGDVRFANRGVIVLGVLGVMANDSRASTALSRGLRVTPDSGVANAAMAQHALLRKKPADAARYAQAVIASSANLGVVHGVHGWGEGLMGDAPQARALFVQALQDAPNVGAIHRWRAETQIKAGDTRGARRSLNEALRLNPDDVAARALLAGIEG